MQPILNQFLTLSFLNRLIEQRDEFLSSKKRPETAQRSDVRRELFCTQAKNPRTGKFKGSLVFHLPIRELLFDELQ